jgi:predicted ATP-dependent protease
MSSTYPAGFETANTTEQTRDAYAALMRSADRGSGERTLDRLRVRWHLCQLRDAGVIRTFYASGGRTIIDARGWQGERAYTTTRELEAFAHGAQAALAGDDR